MSVTLLAGLLLLPQSLVDARLQPRHELTVLVDADPAPFAAFGLGSGGVHPDARDALSANAPGDATTAGGIRVQCRAQGVKLKFTSGRELLFAANGALHLRGGESCAPFPLPVELQLGDGSVVRIRRGGSKRSPIQAVTVAAAEGALELWRNGEPVAASCRPPDGMAVRLVCAGAGDIIYRVEALGPLVAFERLLGPEVERAQQPLRRLAILSTPLLRSLPVLLRRYAKPEPAVADAVQSCAEFMAVGRRALAAGAPLQPVTAGRARWALLHGYELSLDCDGRGPLRLSLHGGAAAVPFVEWSIGRSSAVYFLDPQSTESGSRWYRRRELLPPIASPWARHGEFGEADAVRALVRQMYGDR